MSSFVGASLPGVPPVHYTQDALLEDLSRQMAISSSRRQSRGSNGAYSGNAMRIAKPSSANNSPRNKLMHQRRRTMMNDPALLQKTQQVLGQQYLPTPGPDLYGGNYYEPVKRAARPVSWHPSTQLPQKYQQQYQQHYPTSTQQHQYFVPNSYDHEMYAPVQMPPTPAAYSAYGSPVSSTSPLILPSYTTYELPQQQQHYASPSWSLSAAPGVPAMTQTHTPSFAPAPASYIPAPVPSYAAEPSHSPASWNGNMPSTSYIQSMSAPATPEEPINLHYPGLATAKSKSQEGLYPAAPVEVKVEDDEDDGDILVGLGLYDPPENLHGGLLGASFEPTGKGLKLEDAWEPPAEDEDEADDDNEADDAESEEE